MTCRITAVAARSFSLPFVTPFRNARIHFEALDYIWVEVTADGMTGRGEATVFPGYSSETRASMLEAVQRYMGPALIGRDLFADTELARAMEDALPRNPYARSALDLALVDLRARILNTPAANLFGGILRREIPVAALIHLDEPEQMAANARSSVARGAAGLQVKIAKNAHTSLARVRAVREAVGPEIPIAVDGNTSFSLSEALRTMDLIAPYDIALWEQPLPIGDLYGMARLVAEGSIPIFPDEAITTGGDALRYVQAGAASGFAVKLNKSGINETRKIMAIADAANLPCLPGGMLESNWGTFAGLHFAACLPELVFPSELAGPMMMQDTVTGPPPPRGNVEFSWMLPAGPGWGTGPYDAQRETEPAAVVSAPR